MTSSSTPLFDTVLQQLDLDLAPWRGQGLAVRAPRDGTAYAQLSSHTPVQAQALIDGAHAAFLQWRNTPAPVRGELVRLAWARNCASTKKRWGCRYSWRRARYAPRGWARCRK